MLGGLELPNLCDRRLVDVAADDELGAGFAERGEDVLAAAERPLSRGAPRGRSEVVMESRDPQRGRRRIPKTRGRPPQRGVLDAASLLAPRAHGAHPDDHEVVGREGALRRPEDALPLGEGPREARREGVRDVVVSRNGEELGTEALQDLVSARELVVAAAVGQIARREHEIGPKLRYELFQRGYGLERVAPADVQVRDVEDARGHRRGRLYTRNVADESPELFDDIYLGLRAGGAVRKQRRGEPLSVEEKEALGRWQRLSLWRRLIAIGAFALGTFGLGFTVGGLIFGRWRTARR